jgi:hypothetical protein
MGQGRSIVQFLHDPRDTADGVARLVADADREIGYDIVVTAR